MSVEWTAVVVAIAAAGMTAAFMSGCRRLADQLAVADLQLAECIAVLTERVTHLADLLEKQCSIRGALPPPADHPAGPSLTATTTAIHDPRSIGPPVARGALTLAPVADPNPARTYLAGLAESGRRGMKTALCQAAAVLTQGVGSIDTAPWRRLTADHVVAIKRLMTDSGAAPATINRMRAALRGVARCAWRAGLIRVEQQARIADVALAKARRLPAGRHVTPEEIAALFGVCDLDTPAGARDAVMLALLSGAGLRRSELVDLDLGDYDAADGVITVTGKGGHQRHVYATNDTKTALDAWLSHRGDDAEALIMPVNKGGRIERRRLGAHPGGSIRRAAVLTARPAPLVHRRTAGCRRRSGGRAAARRPCQRPHDGWLRPTGRPRRTPCRRDAASPAEGRIAGPAGGTARLRSQAGLVAVIAVIDT